MLHARTAGNPYFAAEAVRLLRAEGRAVRLAEVRGAEQFRHPDRIPKVQLPLPVGGRVTVRDPRSGRLAALRYVTTTAVPLAVTISIEPFWPTVS